MENKSTIYSAKGRADTSRQGEQGHDRYIPLFSSCFIALKNIRLYPPGHKNVDSSIELAHQAIVKELNNLEPLVFGVARDVLILDEVRIGAGVQALTAFARTLAVHGIVSLTFHKGLERKSLIKFFQLLCQTPDVAAGEEGFQQNLTSNGCRHIEILTVDYDLFQLSEKGGQNVVGAAVRKGRRGSIWLTFTKRLLRGGFREGAGDIEVSAESGDGTADSSVSSDGTIDPVQLARFINENKLAVSSNLQNYGVMLDGILGASLEGAGQQAVAAGSGQHADDRMNAEEISMVVTMLDELNPALRKQFLATTLDKCQENQKNANPEKLLSQLSSTLVFEMLDVANEVDQEISPALLSLMQGFSSGSVKEDTAKAVSPSQHQVETLMAREKYENYVVPEYDALLQTLGQSQQQVEPPVGFFIKEQEKTMADLYLVNQVTRLILVLMDAAVNEEEYRRYGQKLIEIACELPSLGAFSLVDTISRTLSRHADSHLGEEIKLVARECLDRIEGTEFLESIAALLPEASGENKELAVQALVARGAKAAAELVDYYCDEKDQQLLKKVEEYFHKYRVETLAEIVRRLPREKRDKVLILLGIVKDLGVGGAASLLRPMLTHYDEDIRASALEILLPLHDAEAVQYLRDMLHSSEETVVVSALNQAGKHRITALVPDLADLFDYRCLRQGSIERNGRIILVLGTIGDPSALPALEKLVDGNWIFHAKQVEKMKMGLFLSLQQYPVDSVGSLCKKGLESKQPEVVKVCRQMLSQVRRGMS